MGRRCKKLERAFYVIYDNDRLIHYTAVTSKFTKFPFMGDRDLIVSPSRTREEYMRQGLQSFAISRIIREYGTSFGLWYVTDQTNIAPRKCVEKIGFDLNAVGHRKRTWIVRYVIDLPPKPA